MNGRSSAHDKARWSANRLGLDYREEAVRLGEPPAPIIDVHVHINGKRAAKVFADVCDLYGVSRIYTQTRPAEAEGVREALGDRARFVAGPDYGAEDRGYALREGFLKNVERFHSEFGSRMVKFWTAPRYRDFVDPEKDADIYKLDSPWRVRIAQRAQELGMMFMTHVADPDTWFQAKYGDAEKYGTKREQYEPLEIMLDRFTSPWIAAHMGGWPENLEFLDGLLSRHDNLYLDTSATKWMVRELSRHSREEFAGFMFKWKDRILFGTDVVTSDAHLEPNDADQTAFAAHQAQSEEEAFELYASRYWAMRTLLETDYEGESSIADPDLMMVEQSGHDEVSAPMLRGKSLENDVLESIYNRTPTAIVERWWNEHP